MKHKTLSDESCESGPLSLCIGLGLEAERLLSALCAQAQADLIIDKLIVQCGTDPAVINAWSSETPPCPNRVVLVVLVIDARDCQAHDMSRFWAARLSKIGYLRAAIVIRDHPGTVNLLWPEVLSTHFDGVIDLCPQRPLLRRMAAHSLCIGLLCLNESLICYDVADVRNILCLGSQARSAATVWSRPERRLFALLRVWHTLQPKKIQGAIAFLHGSLDFSLQEFDQLAYDLSQLLPKNADFLLAWFSHREWPDGRRGVELMLVGDWEGMPLESSSGWVTHLKQEVDITPIDKKRVTIPSESVASDLEVRDIPFFLRPDHYTDNY